MSFVGTYLHVLDQKSRVCLPQQYRVQLGESFWLRFSTDPVKHIQCMNDDEYNLEFNRFMIRFSRFENSDMTQTMFSARSYQASLDSQGRVTLPQELKEMAEIEDSAYLIGSGGLIRIMSAQSRQLMNERYEREHELAVQTEEAMKANAREAAKNSVEPPNAYMVAGMYQPPYGYMPQQPVMPDAGAQPVPMYPPYGQYPGYYGVPYPNTKNPDNK